MGIPGRTDARICMANGLFGSAADRRNLTEDEEAVGGGGREGVTESDRGRAVLRGNVTRGINRGGVTKGARAGHCASQNPRSTSKIIRGSGTGARYSPGVTYPLSRVPRTFTPRHVRMLPTNLLSFLAPSHPPPRDPCYFGVDYVRGLQLADNR